MCLIDNWKRLAILGHSWLGRRRWGRWYIGLALLSAFVFWMLPSGSFYSTTVGHEKAWLTSKISRLRTELQVALSLTVSRRDAVERAFPLSLLGNTGEVRQNAPLVVSSVLVTGIQALDNGAVSVDFDVRVQDAAYQGADQFAFVFASRIQVGVLTSDLVLQEQMNPDRTSASRALLVYPTSLTGQVESAVFDALFSVRRHGDPANPPSIVVPVSVVRDAKELIEVMQGEPSLAPGQIPRMIYLSVSTITTLGFGDIVPLSTAARTFVTLEAILGVMFAGLFLASIGTRLAERGIGAPSRDKSCSLPNTSEEST